MRSDVKSQRVATSSKTLADLAYAGLRRDIISGLLAPETPLRMAQLCTRYSMGMSPLREALNRLQAEGLVTAIPLRGFLVAPLSTDELTDTTDMRILIETEALRRSITRGDKAWRDQVEADLTALLTAPNDIDPEPLHHSFHRSLISACGSRRLLEGFEKLYAEAERYRYGALHQPATQSGRDSAGEHHAIATACLDGDIRLACDLLANHYRRTAQDQVLRIPQAKPVVKRRSSKAVLSAN